MKSILVESLFTTSAPSPCNARSAGALPAHTLWERGDEAGFSIKVPSDYACGTDLCVALEESSPSAGLNHVWNVRCLLKKEREGHVSTYDESSDNTFVSPDFAETLARRMIKVTGSLNSGTVDNRSIRPGDRLSFILRRSGPAVDEDPAAIKVFNIWVEYETAQASLSGCPGRIGLIMESVRDLFNEPHADFLSADFMLRSINRCAQDVAMEGYWRRYSWVPSQAGRDAIDLMDAIPDFADVYQVCYGPQRWPLTNVTSLKRLERLKTVYDTSGTPEYYLVQNNSLMIVPGPTISLEKGFLIYHSYCPAPMTCSDDNPNPDTPKSYDQLFVYFTLGQAFLRDRGAPGADVKFHEYNALYQSMKTRLMASVAPIRASLKSLGQ